MTNNDFRHFFKRTFSALGIREYFYKNRGGTSKGVDSKITYKLLIKNLQSFILSQNTQKKRN